MCESFFATLECELLARRRFAAASEARPAVFESVKGWYNPRRRHSAIAYMSPVAYEQAAGGDVPVAAVPDSLLKRSKSMLTSVQEVDFHTNRELDSTRRSGDEVRYMELLAEFIGGFPNPHEDERPASDSAPVTGHRIGQTSGTDLHREGHHGLYHA